ncbi:hypothetical protein NDA10_004706 [Ustilago hordei]|nr:hypothetical protein NDA10_004706 [Ustilago hordei]
MEIFILEAEAWFKFNQVYEQSRMITPHGATVRAVQPCNARMEAYNKLLALRLTSDAPGAATRHVERFRDLEGQVNLDDNELVIDLFRARSPSQATTQATIQNLNRPLPHQSPPHQPLQPRSKEALLHQVSTPVMYAMVSAIGPETAPAGG